MTLQADCREAGSLCVELDLARISDVDPHVHVGIAAVVPHKARPFETPIVPHAVVSDVVVGEIHQVALVQAALSLETLHGFFSVTGAIRFQQLL